MTPSVSAVLQGEDGFCVLLGLTLIGVLAGWAFLFAAPPRARVPTDAGLVLIAAPALYLSIAVFFPSAERLVLFMPVLPLIAAGMVRTFFNSRASHSRKRPRTQIADSSEEV